MFVLCEDIFANIRVVTASSTNRHANVVGMDNGTISQPVSIDGDTILTGGQSFVCRPLREVFGRDATMCAVEQSDSVCGGAGLVPMYYDMAMAFVLVVIYSRMVYHYKQLMSTVFKAKFYSYTARMISESLDVGIVKLTDTASLLLVLSMILALTSTARYYGVSGLPDILCAHFMPVVAVVMVVVILWRKMLISVISSFSRAKTFFEAYRFNQRLTFSFWGLIMAPLVLLTAFLPKELFGVVHYVVAAVFVLMAIHYLVEVTKLFIRVRVSFLQYILYLCMVELLPISFIITVVQKIGLF